MSSTQPAANIVGERRPPRPRATGFQATNPILKEKLSPQNTLMPLPVTGTFPAFVFAHQQQQQPHLAYYPRGQVPGFSASTSMGTASVPVGPIYATAPTQLEASLQPQLRFGGNSAFALPQGSSYMFAPAMSPCAAQSLLQQEIAISFMASQSSPLQNSRPPFLSAHPGSSSFVTPTPVTTNPWATAVPSDSPNAPRVYPHHGTGTNSSADATAPRPASGLFQCPAPARRGVEDGATNAAASALSSTGSTAVGSSRAVTSPVPNAHVSPLFVMCDDLSNPKMMTLFSHANTSPTRATMTTGLHKHQALPQGKPPQYNDVFLAPGSSSSATSPTATTAATTTSTTPSAAAAATVSPDSTTSATPAATRVVAEEGKPFNEDPVPIDTTKCQLIVNFLSQKITNEEFCSLFRPYGELFEHASHIIYDFRHGKTHNAAAFDPATSAPNTRSKGYGFIYYRDGASTAGAIRELNGKEVHGRRIKVRYAAQQRSVEDIIQEEEAALIEASVTHMLDNDEDF